MKPLAALVLAAALLPTPARADASRSLLAMPPAARAQLERAGERWARMKNHGIAASVLGMLQLTVGMAAGLVSIMPCHSNVADGCLGNLPAFASGATFTALGAISTTAGIPMWVYGAREARDAQLRLTASAGGLRLTF